MDNRFAETAHAYDSAAVDFAQRTQSRSDMAAAFMDGFLASLPPNALVADLGCGPGHDLRRIASAGHRTLGLDGSGGLLALCPTTGLLTRGDLRALPLKTGSLDAIWCSAALLHVTSTELPATFAEWDRVLTPGGVVGFATSLGGDEGWELVPAGPSRVAELAPGHQRWFVHHTQQSLVAAVTTAGWRIVSATARESTRTWLQVLATTSPEQ